MCAIKQVFCGVCFCMVKWVCSRLVLLNVVCFLSLGVGLCIVSLCSGCDVCCVLSDLSCM